MPLGNWLVAMKCCAFAAIPKDNILALTGTLQHVQTVYNYSDGYVHLSNNERSFFTFMIYLNGGFGAGTTNFLSDKRNVTYRVVPAAGLLLVFPHYLLHEGEAVGSGVKYIMRSDLMYKRVDNSK